MSEAAMWIVVAAAAVALVVAFPLRTRLPSPFVVSILGVAGAALGWGGMLLRPDPSVGELVAAIVLLAVLVPAHVRIVLGRFGPRAPAESPPAARAGEGSPAGP
jgi:hypothetical protein